MEDLAVITALNLSGSFGKNLVQFKGKKNKMLFTSLGLVRIGKNCALRLESSPLLPRSFEEGKAPKQCTLSPSPLYTNLVNKALVHFIFLAFFCFCFFFGGGGGEGVERRGKHQVLVSN